MRLTPIIGLLILGCSSALPCRTCPPVDGVYAVSWDDAGVAGDGGACTVSGPRVPEWTLAQRDTQVTSTIAGVNLGGTLYDSYDLVLSGSEGTLSYRLRALTIPQGSGADAGIRLQGTFTTRTLPATGDPCEVNEAFTAQRTSR
ncbi:MAG: hypothetical protein Q8L48_02055 [Archangium sp.]|nr:hypothetical protein [Archangium sp.]